MKSEYPPLSGLSIVSDRLRGGVQGKGIVVLDDDAPGELSSGVDGRMRIDVSAAGNTRQASLAATGRVSFCFLCGICRIGEGSRRIELSLSVACRDGLVLRVVCFDFALSTLVAPLRLTLFLPSLPSASSRVF